MAVNYVRHATELARSAPEEIATKFNAEISRAARAFPDPTSAARTLIDMHLRHGAAVKKVIAGAVTADILELLDGDVEPTSLLGLVINKEHLKASWRQFASRIVSVLGRGLPAACVSERPANELRLQEICDGLLRAADENLTKEFPFLRWASRMTKPDWSDPMLWVELKYVRSSGEIRQITEDIAADITKYGDNNRRTLFIVYDPSHHLIDEDAFISDIERHEGNAVDIVR
jgi:hypothetical protein